MTKNETYRLGQEDMKRRLARHFRHWYLSPYGAVDKERKPDVAVAIRRHKTLDLPSGSAA